MVKKQCFFCWFRGFAWWVAAVAGSSVGFIGCGIGFCCHVRAVSGWELWLLCGESGVFVVGLFRFRVVKRKRTSHDVPKNKNEKIKYRFYEPFSFVSFSVFAWCKGSVFFCLFGRKVGFFFGFQSGFSVFAWWVSGFFRLVSAKSGVGSGVAGFKCGGCGI